MTHRMKGKAECQLPIVTREEFDRQEVTTTEQKNKLCDHEWNKDPKWYVTSFVRCKKCGIDYFPAIDKNREEGLLYKNELENDL